MTKKTMRAVDDVLGELESATKRHGHFRSPHEGYAILLEEVDELKEEVWKKDSRRTAKRLRAEATQVAAMALRFMVDLT